MARRLTGSTAADVGLAAAVTVLAAVATLPTLDQRGLWVDEARSLGAANQLVTAWRRTGGTMAAFYAVLAPWWRLGDDRVWWRLLPALAGLAALPVLYALARRSFDRPVAVVATTAMATSTLFLRYVPELRSYTASVLVTTVSWWALFELVRAVDARRDGRWRAVWAVATVLGVLVHGVGALQPVLQAAALALRPDRRRRLREAAPVVAVVAALVAGMWVLGGSEVAGWAPAPGRTVLWKMWAGVTGTQVVTRWVVTAAVMGGLAVVLAAGWAERAARTDGVDTGRAHDADGVEAGGAGPGPEEAWRAAVEAEGAAGPGDRREAAWRGLAVAVWALGGPLAIVAASPVRSYLQARYFIGALPGLALLVALAARWPARRLPPRPAAMVAAAAVVILVAVAVPERRHLAGDAGPDWRGAARLVATKAQPGDGLMVPEPELRSAFDVGWIEAVGRDGASPVTPISPSNALGEPLRFPPVPPFITVLDVSLEEHPRVWVVGQQPFDPDRKLDRLLASPPVRAGFTEAGRWLFSQQVEVVLLVQT